MKDLDFSNIENIEHNYIEHKKAEDITAVKNAIEQQIKIEKLNQEAYKRLNESRKIGAGQIKNINLFLSRIKDNQEMTKGEILDILSKSVLLIGCLLNNQEIKSQSELIKNINVLM